MERHTPARMILCLCAAVAPAWAQSDSKGAGGDEPPAAPTLTVDEAVHQAEAALDAIPSTERAVDRAKLLRTAERLIAQIEGADAANPWLYYLRGRAWAIGGTKPIFDAISQLNTFIETHIGQSYWKAYVALGDLYADAWPVQAKSKYLRADELNPDHAKTLYGLSVCASKTGEKEAALDYAKRAVESATADERIKYLTQLARLEATSKNWDDAYEAALQARGLAEARRRDEPTSPAPLRTLETQLQVLINTVKGSLVERQNDTALYLKLIEYMEELADVHRELMAFEILNVVELGAAHIGPSRPVAFDEKRVEILLSLGRRDEAVKLCEEIHTRSPNSAVCADLIPSPDSPAPP